MADTEDILGYKVTRASLQDCLGQVAAWVDSRASGRYLVCANPHSLEVARIDAAFREALMDADIIVPDGAGIVLASRLLGGGISSRITGSDIFHGVNSLLNSQGGRVFFLGSTEATLQKILTKMASDYPLVRIAGTFSPPFRERFSEEENAAMAEAVNSVRPDVLWVGMTAPKQEKWVHENRFRLDVPFIGPVGAVFDFYAGNIRRSSPAFQSAGLEWLPRLLREPRRLWRRNLISSPSFLMRVILAKFGVRPVN